MLTFYQSKKLEELSARFNELMANNPPEDPLATEIVIVQNHGMARWLSTTLARGSGIAANVSFEFPAERVWSIYRSAHSDIPENLPSDRGPMSLAIFEELQDLPDEAPYRQAWNYIRGEAGEWDAVKCWKLAVKIADLFDQYLVYRPDMILRWEESSKLPLDRTEAWQAGLWNRLKDRWDKHFTAIDHNHRAQIHRSFMQKIGGDKLQTADLPERITLFGLSSLPPAFIELFATLSGLVDVHWFRMMAPERPRYPELDQSWGEEGREFKALLQEYTTDIAVTTEVIRGNSTGAVQNGGSRTEAGRTPDLFDQPNNGRGSSGFEFPELQIHSCHSPQREVEVLHDNLLACFDGEEHPTLEPDDILVLCTDIETYAPFIRAVFGSGQEELPDIPFHIMEDYSGPRKEMFQVFVNLLELLESRFKVTEVVDLLYATSVRRHFDISEDELERLQEWIGDTRVRWGLSEADKHAMDLPGGTQFTWVNALNRLMMGFTSRFENELFNGLYPHGSLENSEDAILLGKFSRFLTRLQHARKQVYSPHTPTEWCRVLNDLLSDFLPADDRYSSGYKTLVGLFDQFREYADLAALKQKVRYPVIRDYITRRLTAEAGRGGYRGHGITFSGLDQMRSLPHKVIAMIGMNNDVFPRSRVTPEFDLMSRHPRPGDRITRNDDRYLFLETLRSARRLFYVSYIGQSDRDDSPRPPSVLVSELLDSLASANDVKPEELVVKHPLQAFSRKYFDREQNELVTYSETSAEIYRRLKDRPPKNGQRHFMSGDERLPEAGESFRKVSIRDLVRFFRHPLRYLAEQRLGLQIRDHALLTEDREPFEMGGLENYLLGNELLDRQLHGREITNYRQIAKAKGLLPEGWPGRKIYEEKEKEVTEFCEALQSLLSEPGQERVEVRIEAGEFLLTGVLNSLYRNYQLFFRYGRQRYSDLMESWIYHLVLLHKSTGLDIDKSLLVTRKNDA
ncbi:MAG: exodeoxyribonuclease V subunit gamma, partial [Balneolaceae bacterium]|nr:exodeoxyribonuclease V subunit gamma [Balneolaceae bacterium]